MDDKQAQSVMDAIKKDAEKITLKRIKEQREEALELEADLSNPDVAPNVKTKA